MTSDQQSTLGLVIRRVDRHSTTYIEAEVMRREGDTAYPRGISYCSYEPEYNAADVKMKLFVSTGWRDDQPAEFVCTGIGCDAFQLVDLRRAKALVGVLGKIDKQISKDSATDYGDRLLSFARAVGAQWIAIAANGGVASGGSWSDSRWYWYGLTDGRNAFRALLADILAAESAALAERRKHAIAAQ